MGDVGEVGVASSVDGFVDVSASMVYEGSWWVRASIWRRNEERKRQESGGSEGWVSEGEPKETQPPHVTGRSPHVIATINVHVPDPSLGPHSRPVSVT